MFRWIPKMSTLFVIIAGIILLILFARAFGVIDSFESAASYVTSPVYKAFYGAGSAVSGVFSRPSDFAALEKENEELRTEVRDLKLELSKLQSAKQENVSLRQLLDFFEGESDDLPRVLTRVIGRDPENPTHVILNAGERDGIEQNNAVVVEDGIMVAKITEVRSRTSVARLLTDSGSSVAVTISGGLPTSKLARGERGLSLILDQVPQGEILSQGQLVITSGLEPAIPRGLLVGEIEEVVSESDDLFQQAVLRPVTDYESLLYVAVILSPR